MKKQHPDGSIYVCSTWGYVMEKRNGKWVRQHRAVMEQLLGRPLSRSEVVHHINGNKTDNRPENLELMSPDEWKDVLTAAFRKEQARLAMGLDGGVVMLGQRTSKFSKREFSEWLEFLHATAADRGVNVYQEETT